MKKNNFYYSMIKFFIITLFSITLTLDCMLCFHGKIYGNLSKNSFVKFEPKFILTFIISFISIYVFIYVAQIVAKKIDKKFYFVKNKKNRENYKTKFFIVLFIILIISWLPYILSFFPGGIYSDTLNSIAQADGSIKLNNHHPILYTLIIKLFMSFGSIIRNQYFGLKLFSIFQVILMALIIDYFIYKLYRNNVNMKIIFIIIAYFCIFDLIPLYAISLWKDVPFSLALFLFIIFLIDIVKTNGNILKSNLGMLKYIIFALLVMFLRNNGIYIVIVTSLLIFIMYKKILLKENKKFIAIMAGIIILTVIVQHKVYDSMKLNGPFVENLGVMQQQINYVVTTDGNLNKEQVKFINKIYSIENIKKTYNPCIIDTVKWNSKFNNKYLEANKSKYIKYWIQIGISNPKAYVKAFLLETIGYWDINKSTLDGYTGEVSWGSAKLVSNEFIQRDYIKKIFGKSIRKNLSPKKAISVAIFFFISLFGLLITIYKKRYKNILIYIPELVLYLTILIATPVAFTLRYVYIFVLMVPLNLIIPFIKIDKNNF